MKSQIACTTFCTCFPGATSIDTCAEQCVAKGDFAVVPEDCFECIQSHANQCSTLEDDCEALCVGPRPPHEDLPDGGMR